MKPKCQEAGFKLSTDRVVHMSKPFQFGFVVIVVIVIIIVTIIVIIITLYI